MKGPDLHKDVQNALSSKRQLEIFTHSRGRLIQHIDFQHAIVADGFNTGHYCIMLSDEIGPGEVVCLLPNNGSESKQVLRSSKYSHLSSLNRDLNRQFRDSIDFTDTVGNTKLAVCYGNHVFICKGITGTVYVVWAKHVNYTNTANVASEIHSNIPLIINKDGKMVTKGIYILKPNVHDAADLARLPITKKSPELLFPLDASIFVSEVRQVQQPHKKIATLSKQNALARVLSPVKSTTSKVSRERNPFSASVDFEDDAVGWISGDTSASFNYGSDPDAGTPRLQLYCQDIPTDLRKLNETPPIVHSDGEDDAKVPDPFQ